MMQYYSGLSGQGTGETRGEQAPSDPLAAQRLRTVGDATGATVLAFYRQTGIDPAAEFAQTPQSPQPSPAPEALGGVATDATNVVPPFPQGPENLPPAA